MNDQGPTRFQQQQWLRLQQLINQVLDEDDLVLLEGAKFQRILKADRDANYYYVDVSLRLRIPKDGPTD